MHFRFAALVALLSAIAAFAQSGPNAFKIPTGGWQVTAGKPITLQWTPSTAGTVSLLLRHGAGSDLSKGVPIASDLQNSGSYTWTPASNLPRRSDYTIEDQENVKVTGRAQSEVEARKDELADQLEGAAHAIHRAGAQLEGEQDWLARLVERGAAELGTLAQSLRTNDLRSLMGNLDELARRQPALFAGASLAAGFALARVGRVAVAGASRSDLPQLPRNPLEASPETSNERS